MAVRRFRRRRKKFTWLPTTPTQIVRDGQATFEVPIIQESFTFQENVDVAHVTVPINPFDAPIEPDAVGDYSLDDLIGNEYVVERIVGNAYIYVAQTAQGATAATLPAVIVCLGMFVGRADGQNQENPIGSANVEESSRNYNPLDNGTQREPWMFRRTWALSAMLPRTSDFGTSFQYTAFDFQRSFPLTTAGYHGLRTGPFFDVKSKRRIGQDDRLWLVIAAKALSYVNPAPGGANYLVNAFIDLRMLGALRKARQQSAF